MRLVRRICLGPPRPRASYCSCDGMAFPACRNMPRGEMEKDPVGTGAADGKSGLQIEDHERPAEGMDVGRGAETRLAVGVAPLVPIFVILALVMLVRVSFAGGVRRPPTSRQMAGPLRLLAKHFNPTD